MANEEHKTEAEAIAAMAASADIRDVDGQPVALLPPGWEAEHIDLSRFEQRPRRHFGAARLRTAAALIAYVGSLDWQSAWPHARLYADAENGKLVVVLNDHGAPDGAQGWQDFRAVLHLPYAEEWIRWTGIDGKMLSQTAFAEFVEENAVNIRTPDGATILELAQSLEARVKVSWQSSQRLSDGRRQFKYVEEVEGAGKGQITVPERLGLGIPVYYGGDRWPIHAALRYRMEDGALKMGIKLLRAAEVRDEAFDTIATDVAEQTGLLRIDGTI